MFPALFVASVLNVGIAADESTDAQTIEEIVITADIDPVELTASALTAGRTSGEGAGSDTTYQRLFSVTEGEVSPSHRSPFWMWPLALFGLVGVAGVAYRNRSTEPSGGTITVVSRTMLSKGVSVAVIEVGDHQGETRRMLIGIGGGAPRLVAELSIAERSDGERVYTQRPELHDANSDKTFDNDFVPRMSSDTISGRYSPLGRPCGQTDGDPEEPLERRQRLVAEVLDSRKSEPDSNLGKAPWARNFEALLHRYVG